MKTNQYHKIPFEDGDFNFDKFEAFVNALLNSECEVRLGFDEKIRMSSLKTTYRYGKQGDKQRGIDLVAQTVGGRIIVFQCKYHESSTTRVGLPIARKAVKKATEEYPEADEYVLLTNTSFTPGALDYFTENSWVMLGSDELHGAVRSLPSEDGYDLLVDHFGKIAADHFYPLGPHLLVSPKRFKNYQVGALSHKYACIGREKEIKRIVRKLTSKKKSCVIVAAEGGVGKSRLMCEVLERIEKMNEKNYVKILQAENSGSAKQINLADRYTNHVIAIDDAHIGSNMRSDVLLSVSEMNGHLLLMSRPEGLNSIRASLRKTGWEIQDDDIEILELMKRSDLVDLASEVKKSAKPMMSEIVSLVDYSEGNALFTVIAAQLVNEGYKFKDVVVSGEFRSKVFQALEDNFLDNLKTESGEIRKKVVRTMKIIALFSPVDRSNLNKVSDFLGLSEFELDDHLEYLSQAGLLRENETIIKISPDLFSDYVVSKFIRASNNQSIVKSLQQADLMEIVGPDVFKNLALAEWLLRQKNQSILKSLWGSYKATFSKKKWTAKGSELKKWCDFSFYLPEESMELAQLTFNADEDDFFYLKSSAHAMAHELLVSVCKNYSKHNWSALDLIFRNLNTYSKQGLFTGNSEKHPFQSIFNIKNDNKYRALDWLEDRLSDASFKKGWVDNRNDLVSLSFKGIFTKVVNDTYMTGNTFHFGDGLVIYEKTVELRSKGLELLKNIALSNENGALNSINVLTSGARFVRGVHGYIDDDKVQEKWLPFRIKCIELLTDIAAHHADPIINYEIAKILKSLYWKYEPLPDFEKKRLEALDSLSVLPDIGIVKMMLSYGNEMTSNDFEQRQIEWGNFVSETVVSMMSNHGHLGFLDECRRLHTKLINYGYSPNLTFIINAVSEQSPELIELMRVEALKGDEMLKGYYMDLAYWYRKNENHDEMLSEGFSEFGINSLNPILDILEQNRGSLLNTRTLVWDYIHKAEGEELMNILKLTSKLWSEEKRTVILENIDCGNLSVEHMYFISSRLDVYSNERVEFHIEFLLKVFYRLKKSQNINRGKVADLLQRVAQTCPLEVYEYIKPEVLLALEKNDVDALELAFPYSLDKMRFKGKGEITETEIEEIFGNYLSSDDKSIYQSWLKIVMTADGGLSETLYKKRLDTILDEEEFKNFLFHESWIKNWQIFNNTEIIRHVLKRAEQISGKCLKSITKDLAYVSMNTSRSYTNGILDNQTTLEKALQYRERFREDELVFKYYDAVVKVEREDIERNRANYERNLKTMDDFN